MFDLCEVADSLLEIGSVAHIHVGQLRGQVPLQAAPEHVVPDYLAWIRAFLPAPDIAVRVFRPQRSIQLFPRFLLV